MGRRKQLTCSNCNIRPKAPKMGTCLECNRLLCNIKHKMKWDKAKLEEKIQWHLKEISIIKDIIKLKTTKGESDEI